MLQLFNETYQNGDDHVISWLYLLRDSVLLNPHFGSIEQRKTLQKQIIQAAKPFEEDPVLEEITKAVLGEIESLTIESEEEEPLESPIPVSGTFGAQATKNGRSAQLQISQMDQVSFRFQLNLKQEVSPYSTGIIEGEAKLDKVTNQAVFATREFGDWCKLNFIFDEKGVSIKTNFEDAPACGLANGIVVDGYYDRQSYNNPFLSASETKKIASLQGEWKSSDDPKAKIKIAAGRYQDWYDGKQVETFLYIYYPNCPKDCNPMVSIPCLKIIGQDEVCYVIVKVNVQYLELLPIGGTGKTNKYYRLTE
jgi:hypothetical protein